MAIILLGKIISKDFRILGFFVLGFFVSKKFWILGIFLLPTAKISFNPILLRNCRLSIPKILKSLDKKKESTEYDEEKDH